jgi:hypothetical protein
MRKGKDPDPDPSIWLIDQDPGDLKTRGSGSSTLVYSYIMQYGRYRYCTYQMLDTDHVRIQK